MESWNETRRTLSEKYHTETERRKPGKALALGVLAAFGASLCCVGPLVFASVGLGGSMAVPFRVFDPYRPFLIVLSIGALVTGFTRIRKARRCDTGKSVSPRNETWIFWIITLISLFLILLPWVRKHLA